MNEDECSKFLKNPRINPRTGRKISPSGKVYKELAKECSPKRMFKSATGRRRETPRKSQRRKITPERKSASLDARNNVPAFAFGPVYRSDQEPSDIQEFLAEHMAQDYSIIQLSGSRAAPGVELYTGSNFWKNFEEADVYIGSDVGSRKPYLYGIELKWAIIYLILTRRAKGVFFCVNIDLNMSDLVDIFPDNYKILVYKDLHTRTKIFGVFAEDILKYQK